MAQFVDFRKHLQDILDSIANGVFNVCDERNLDASIENKAKVDVVIRALAGNVYQNSASIPYEINVVSVDPKQVLDIFTAIAKEKNGKSFISLVEEGEETKEYTVYEYYTTPSIVEAQKSDTVNQPARLVLFATLNVLFEVGNVSHIKVDDEEIEFLSATLAFSVEPFANRVSGETQIKALKRSSSTTLSLQMVSKECTFVNNLYKLAYGEISRKIFTVNIKLTTGQNKYLRMICSRANFNYKQNSPALPSIDVELAIADIREVI